MDMSKLTVVLLSSVVSLTVAGSMVSPVYATNGSSSTTSTKSSQKSDDDKDNKTSQKDSNDCDNKDTKNDDKDNKNTAVTTKDNDDHDKKDNDDKEKTKPVATTSAATVTPAAQPATLPNAGMGSVAPLVGLLAAVAGYFGYLLHLKRRTV
jgi:biopolymer transport protein ExbB/TolQ